MKRREGNRLLDRPIRERERGRERGRERERERERERGREREREQQRGRERERGRGREREREGGRERKRERGRERERGLQSLLFSKEICNATSILWISLAKVLNYPLLDELSSILCMTSNVLNETGTLLLVKCLAVEPSNLTCTKMTSTLFNCGSFGWLFF